MKKNLILATIAISVMVGRTMTAYASPVSSSTVRVEYETKATESQLEHIRVLFNATEYAEMYPDVVAAVGTDEDALWNHFVNYGLAEGRNINRSFNVFAYRASYADLRKEFGNNLASYYEHYVLCGKEEGRALVTVEAAQKAGFTVYDMNGIAYPCLVRRDENNQEASENGQSGAFYNNVTDTDSKTESATVSLSKEEEVVYPIDLPSFDPFERSIPRQPEPAREYVYSDRGSDIEKKFVSIY